MRGEAHSRYAEAHSRKPGESQQGRAAKDGRKRERPTSGSEASSGARPGPNGRKSIAAPRVESYNKCDALASPSDEEGDDQPQNQGLMGGPAVVP